MEPSHYADVALGQRLLEALRSSEVDFLALRDGCERSALGKMCEALGPFKEQICKEMGPLVKEVRSEVHCRQAVVQGAKVLETSAGRSLITSKFLQRGSVVIREFPLAKVLLESKKKSTLHPETQLALLLAKSAGRSTSLPEDLLDHGGKDSSSLAMRATLAACCGLCLEDSLDDVVSLFRWLGRVRINAVAVTALVESAGDMVEDKVALALYSQLARSVLGSQKLKSKLAVRQIFGNPNNSCLTVVRVTQIYFELVLSFEAQVSIGSIG